MEVLDHFKVDTVVLERFVSVGGLSDDFVFKLGHSLATSLIQVGFKSCDVGPGPFLVTPQDRLACRLLKGTGLFLGIFVFHVNKTCHFVNEVVALL